MRLYRSIIPEDVPDPPNEPQPMASPAVEQTATSTSSGTSHTVSIPIGLTLGNILIVCFACDGDEGGNVGWPDATWHELYDAHNSGNDVTLAIAWHEVDSSTPTGGSITVTTVGGEGASHCAYEISGAEVVTAEPELTAQEGDSANPDPPSHTASITGEDNLWIAVCASDRRAITGYPTNCPDHNISDAASPGPGGADCGMASDQLTQDTFNPDTYTIDSGDEWLAATICVFPTGAAPPAGQPWDIRDNYPLPASLGFGTG